MNVRTTCTLTVKIGECTEKVKFLVCNELGTDVTLGRTWLKAKKAVFDHDLGYLYLVTEMRRRVFLAWGTHPLSWLPPLVSLKAFNTAFLFNTRRNLKNYSVILETFSFAPALCDKHLTWRIILSSLITSLSVFRRIVTPQRRNGRFSCRYEKCSRMGWLIRHLHLIARQSWWTVRKMGIFAFAITSVV